jgi:hypothetical protein
MRWFLLLTLTALPALSDPLDALVAHTRALPDSGDRVALLLRLSPLRPALLAEAQQAASNNPAQLSLVAVACAKAQAWPALAQTLNAATPSHRAVMLQQIAAIAPEHARQLGWQPPPTYADLQAALVAGTPHVIRQAFAAVDGPQRWALMGQATQFVSHYGAYPWRRARLLELVDLIGQLPASERAAARKLLSATFLQIGDPSIALLLAEGLTDAHQRTSALNALVPALRHLSEADATLWPRLQRLAAELPAGAPRDALQLYIAGAQAAHAPASTPPSVRKPTPPPPAGQTFDPAVRAALAAGQLARATAAARALSFDDQLDTRRWILRHHLAFNARPVTAWKALITQLKFSDDDRWDLAELAEAIGHHAGALDMLAEMPEHSLDERLTSVAALAERALDVGQLKPYAAAFKRLGTMEYMEHPGEGDCVSEDDSSAALAGAQQLELLLPLAEAGAAALAQRLARRIAHPVYRARAHATLAEHFTNLGDYEQALREAQAAGDPRSPADPCEPCEVTPCPDEDPQPIGSEALVALADTAAELGRVDVALRALPAVPNPEDRGDLALTLADRAVAAGLTKALLQEATRVPNATEVRLAVVHALANAGRLSQALDVVDTLPAGEPTLSGRITVYEAARALDLILGPLAKRITAR